MKLTASVKAKKIDEDYKLSEKASHVGESIKQTASLASSKAQENATIMSGVNSVKTGFASVSTTMSGIYQDYKEQTAKAIEEKQKERHRLDGTPATESKETVEIKETNETKPTVSEVSGETTQ